MNNVNRVSVSEHHFHIRANYTVCDRHKLQLIIGANGLTRLDNCVHDENNDIQSIRVQLRIWRLVQQLETKKHIMEKLDHALATARQTLSALIVKHGKPLEVSAVLTFDLKSRADER